MDGVTGLGLGGVCALFISPLTGKKQSSRARQIHLLLLSVVTIQQPTAIQHFSLLKKILHQSRKSNNTGHSVLKLSKALILDCISIRLCCFTRGTFIFFLSMGYPHLCFD